MGIVYLSLGTNLGERELNLKSAIKEIADLGSIDQISAVYETEPWGFRSENKFLNMVVEIHTEIIASQLIKECLKIEAILGRTRGSALGYESRIIDIDILFYGAEIVSADDLIIPHPHIQDRKFILEPLNELAPNFIHPVLGKTVSEILKNSSDQCKVNKIGTIII